MQRRLAATLLVLLAACSARPETPEEKVRAVLTAVEKAAEDRDVAALLEHVSESYRDARGNDRQALAQLATFHFLQNRGVHLFVEIRQVVVEIPGEARAAAVVAMAGRPIASAEALPSLHASLYYFDVELREEAGGWRIVRATWSPATIDDF
jgi:hypothetical protein